MVSYNSVAEMMQSQAEQDVSAARSYHVDLDYSEASLEQLEEILGRLYRAMPSSKRGLGTAVKQSRAHAP